MGHRILRFGILRIVEAVPYGRAKDGGASLMSGGDIVVETRNVSKKYARSLKQSISYGIRDILFNAAGLDTHSGILRPEEFWAVEDVSFELKMGEVLGIIGPNGAGKSTILKMLNGIFMPDRGQIEIRGRVGALIEVGAGFHPLLTGRENIYVNAAILGMSRREVAGKLDRIIDFSGLAEHIDTPVKFYSSGMYVRLGFSVAAHLDPDVLLVDEVLSVGDLSFRRKCLDRMKQIRAEGTAIVFISHYMQHVDGFCDKAIFLNHGKAEHAGPTMEAIAAYELNSNINADVVRDSALCHPAGYHTAEIEIYGVTFMGRDLSPKTVFYPGDTFIARIRYRAPRRFDNPVLSLAIIRSDGVYCVRERTRYHGITIPYIEGEGEFSVEIDPLQLSSGRYRTEIIIWDPEIVLPYVSRMQDDFVVSSHMPSIPDNIGQSVFHPHIKWHIPEA
jgi:lipopolysaccharide transport system ATP-binding protein